MIAIQKNKLKGFRLVELDMTQEDMANKIGIAKSTYNRKERNPDKFLFSEVIKIANISSLQLKRPVTINELFFSQWVAYMQHFNAFKRAKQM